MLLLEDKVSKVIEILKIRIIEIAVGSITYIGLITMFS